MKRLILAAALVAAFPVFAQSNSTAAVDGVSATASPTISSGNSSSGSYVEGVSSSANPNNSAQQMIQLNTYGPDRQALDSTSTSNSTSRIIQEGTSTQNVHYSGTQTVKNVAPIAMSGPASGPCTGASGGIGLSLPGGALGVNGAKVDDGCTVRENTRVLGQLFQALPNDDPLKIQAKDALVRSLDILDAMNEGIGDEYLKKSRRHRKEVVAVTPVMMPVAPPSDCAGYKGNDPIVRNRMCGK